MDVPDEQVGYDEELSAADASRARWTAVAVAVVLLLGALLVARAAAHHQPVHRIGNDPIAAPVPAAAEEGAHLGSVFLAHLPQCTTTDHRHRLTVALGVTNLGRRTLRLVSAAGLTSNPFAVRSTTESMGGPPCGRRLGGSTVPIRPGGVAVVRLQFYVADKCPGAALVSARIGFDGGQTGLLHADSSQLANLAQLDFNQCA